MVGPVRTRIVVIEFKSDIDIFVHFHVFAPRTLPPSDIGNDSTPSFMITPQARGTRRIGSEIRLNRSKIRLKTQLPRPIRGN
jgi:hypothetical protein